MERFQKMEKYDDKKPDIAAINDDCIHNEECAKNEEKEDNKEINKET